MKTGLTVKPQNIQQLATAINMLLEDERLAKNLGTQAREKIKKEFSYEVVIPQIAKAIKDIAENNSKT
jgi:glycosyltransferase involved in cell wall biosynthesis